MEDAGQTERVLFDELGHVKIILADDVLIPTWDTLAAADVFQRAADAMYSKALRGIWAEASVTCSAEGCSARFFHVPGREFPGLCLDHAADAARERHGWTPANSLS